MSLQSLPSRNFSDSDPITPWEQKNRGRRKSYVLVHILMNKFQNFHIFWSMGTFLCRNINILPRWLINPPIYRKKSYVYIPCTCRPVAPISATSFKLKSQDFYGKISTIIFQKHSYRCAPMSHLQVMRVLAREFQINTFKTE